MEVLAVGAPPQQPDDVAVPEVAQHLHLGESGGRRSVRLQASAPHGHDGEHHAHAHALEQRDAALDASEPFLSGRAREATRQQASEQSATFKIFELNELINTTSNIQAETQSSAPSNSQTSPIQRKV